MTTFLLSGHNASFIPDLIWVGPALFYGGAMQLLAGMWEFKNRNVFGATAFSTYGGFWIGLGIFVVLANTTKFAASFQGGDLTNALAWYLFAFAIFNTYMLIGSTRVSGAVFLVFLTLELTEIATRHRVLQRSRPAASAMVAALRRLARDPDGSGRVVRIRGRRDERHGWASGVPGGPRRS